METTNNRKMNKEKVIESLIAFQLALALNEKKDKVNAKVFNDAYYLVDQLIETLEKLK